MSSKPGFIRRFFSALGGLLTFTRNFVLNVLFLVLLLIFLGALLNTPRVEVPAGSALVLAPSGVLVEQESLADPLASLFGGPLSGGSGETRLRDVLQALELAREDERIRAVVLQLGNLQNSGFSKLREIGAAIQAFRSSGKRVYAVGDSYTQGQYYLAAHADEILLHPFGNVQLEGFGAYQTYFAEALERLGVNLHIFRVGEFKSAVEPFERTGMSEEARSDNLNWLNDLWGLYLGDVGEQRGLPPDAIQDGIDNLDVALAAVDGDYARMALQRGLVDRVGTRPEIHRFLVSEIGGAAARDFARVDFRDYLRAQRGQRAAAPPATNGNVAVVTASGIIYDGEQVAGNIGGDTLAGLLDRAREMERVKAVVLRLDTGGGSAFASEVIRNALLELREAGKPVVVSMGSVAASGGYWIAAAADRILADPATLTGSIGIFALFPTFRETFDRLGIHTDGVATSPLAGALVVGNELPPVAVNAIQENLQFGYRRFLEVVAQGRGMTTQEVDELAQGRVWSGRRALEVGLVDGLGGVADAVSMAAELAGLEGYGVESIERGLTPAERLIRQIGEALGLSARAPAPLAGSAATLLRQIGGDLDMLLRSNDPRGLYLQCLECSMF